MSRPRWLTTQPTRAVRANICHRCHAEILEGLDDDRAALVARVDPQPVDNLGEYLAIAAGRSTYSLRRVTPRRYELDHRDQWRIRGHQWPVHAQHICAAAPLPSPPPKPPAPPAAAATEVPF